MGVSVDAIAYPNAIMAASRTRHRRCARCGKVVSRRALACRRCGKKQRVNPRTTMIALAAAFVLALFGLATVGSQLPALHLHFGATRGAQAAQGSAPTRASLGLAAGTVHTATELWGLYNLDAAKADARFKDRTVDVTGTVSEVRHDFRGNLLLRLATGDSFDSVRAIVLDRDDGAHPAPARGQVVTLRCTGNGAVIGAPLLGRCVPL
jgi:hypothetical protein